MAAKRSIPTSLFASPDFFELSTDTIRLILIGIILDADDEGRGSAHSRLLARKLDKHPEEIEQAFVELEAHDILHCYMVEMRRYYTLCHWHKYQVLSRPTPSTYPLPPDGQMPVSQTRQEKHGIPREPLDSPGDSVPEEEEKGRELEQEMKRREAEGEKSLSRNIPSSSPPLSDDSIPYLSSWNDPEETKRVASHLKLSVSENLCAIVQEFLQTPTISLVGEAIEARAWIDDQRRNSKGQQMTPAFFRRWLKRERGDYGMPEQNVKGMRSTSSPSRQKEKVPVSASKLNQQADDPYRTFFLQRVAEVEASSTQEALAS